MPHLQLKQLRQLIMVAEKGSIRQAAEALSIAQPALSRSIRSIEESLQVKLMNRGPRGIELTEYGKTLVSYGKIIEANLRFASEEIDELRGSKEGHVNLGIGPFEGFTIAHIAIDRLLERRPDAEISVIEGDFDVLSAKLLVGEIDIMLGPSQLNNSTPGLNTEILAESRPVLVVRAEHPFANLNQVSLKKLSEAGWILPPSDARARPRLNNVFIRHGLVPPKGPIEMAPGAAAIALLRRRDLIGMLSRQQIGHELQEGSMKVLPIDNDDFVLPMQLTTREFGKLAPACRDMISEIKAVCLEVADTL
ncbi:MAG: LysR family transcriptional regulator [Rhodospirillaceae bacterium]|jgi:DNA-binding transcriptional LysR family regulator|nr:LysR family transcriptional regulator [Rhodospirillaceae bacterium]MBT5940458.1 LysR family transcriptional regulator [Rhodospirillaceae bacterium]MBT7267715.1 LysR family transcriptional regulator [Rhodospirillaceae bacterium]